MLNRILSFFGLLTINLAKEINKEIVHAYERSMMKSLREDFNIESAPQAFANNSEWAKDSFDTVLKKSYDRNKIEVLCEWETVSQKHI